MIIVRLSWDDKSENSLKFWKRLFTYYYYSNYSFIMIIPKCPLFFLIPPKEVASHRNITTTRHLYVSPGPSRDIRENARFWVGVDKFVFWKSPHNALKWRSTEVLMTSNFLEPPAKLLDGGSSSQVYLPASMAPDLLRIQWSIVFLLYHQEF